MDVCIIDKDGQNRVNLTKDFIGRWETVNEDKQDPYSLTQNDTEKRFLAWSPDEKKVVFRNSDSLFSVDVKSGEISKIFEHAPDNFWYSPRTCKSGQITKLGLEPYTFDCLRPWQE